MPFLLLLDVLSAKALVWVGSRGQASELTSDAHQFFFDRYSRLAVHYERRGQSAKAMWYRQRAGEHGWSSGDGPPHAAALAMPRPSRFIRVNAVSRPAPWNPDDAA